MGEAVQFWMQLITLGGMIAGGFWAVARALGSRFSELEGKIEGLTAQFNSKLDTEIKHVHLRVDKLYMRFMKKAGDDDDES